MVKSTKHKGDDEEMPYTNYLSVSSSWGWGISLGSDELSMDELVKLFYELRNSTGLPLGTGKKDRGYAG